ncbi:hypothetical protein B0T22DRAFT_169848 [Podospora appendiculata]|uniref:Uncharacterized protein n=1 Tax=Podospora appendiculata TaxID=314037 RepID=A0AAE1CDD3_9PEZI|nr:hypothetical protein B0T22DRAFT_169848 [Podospora appendiculata]
MNPNNPLADRENALEIQWIREKEKQMAKDRAAKKAQEAKSESKGQGQQETSQEQK